MSRNHRNRSWRAKWILDEATGIARHKTGVLATVIDGEIVLDTSRYSSTIPLYPDFFIAQAEMIFEVGLFMPENFDDAPRM